MSNEIDQIKERVGVVELVGEYLKLEKAGSNYKGLCPFHNEKTPSFMVNPDRNFWYCFGCQKGGDVFTFVQEMEGVEFPEALKRLAQKAGVELPKYQKTDQAQRSAKERIFELMELATKVYAHFLDNHPKSPAIKEYLHGRKLTKEIIGQFRLGYAPAGWRTLLEFLLKKGYSITDIAATGLAVEKTHPAKSSQDLYDRFRDRIMFPIFDSAGRAVGFSARIAPGVVEEGAKYINTPQTTIYDKSAVLYGLHQAKSEIRKQNFTIVVEGNMDVIASHVAGLKNIVAVSGTALSAAQVQMLKRYSDQVKLCFDMDEAGQRATGKSIRMCLREALEVEIILLPAGSKDVGDLVEKDPNEWKNAVTKAIPVMEYFFASSLSRLDPDKVEDKKKIARELLNVIKDIADPIEQGYWIKKLSAKIAVDEDVLTGVLEKVRVEEAKAPEQTDTAVPAKMKQIKSRIRILEERLLGLYSAYRAELAKQASQINTDLFEPETKSLWEHVSTGDASQFENELSRIMVSIKFRYDENQGFVENEVDCLKEWETTVEEINKERKKEKLRRISLDIRRAQDEGDEEAVELLMHEFNEVNKQK